MRNVSVICSFTCFCKLRISVAFFFMFINIYKYLLYLLHFPYCVSDKMYLFIDTYIMEFLTGNQLQFSRNLSLQYAYFYIDLSIYILRNKKNTYLSHDRTNWRVFLRKMKRINFLGWQVAWISYTTKQNTVFLKLRNTPNYFVS